jgi:large subunit ribosomal protein L18
MSNATQRKNELRTRRQIRVRAKISGTSERPRLSIFRSAKHIYAQVIDDVSGKTLAAAKDAEIKKADLKAVEGMQAKTATAYAVGSLLAEKAKKAGVKTVVFDRGGNAYHGRVKALADGARAGGLAF